MHILSRILGLKYRMPRREAHQQQVTPKKPPSQTKRYEQPTPTMKLLSFTATLGLASAFNASLERRTPSRRAIAALKASQMEAFERAVECAGKIRRPNEPRLITYPLFLDSLSSHSHLNKIKCIFSILSENFGYCNLDELETLAAGKFVLNGLGRFLSAIFPQYPLVLISASLIIFIYRFPSMKYRV